MPTEADHFWTQMIDAIREALNVRPLSQREADEAYVQAKGIEVPLSDKETESIVRRVLSADDVPESESWGEVGDKDVSYVAEDTLVLNKNRGECDADTAERLDRQRKEILRDAEQERKGRPGLQDQDPTAGEGG